MQGFDVYMWPLINLAAITFLAVRYARKPISNFIANYRNQVAHSIERAEEDRRIAEEQLDSWRTRWEEIDGEGSAVLGRAREMARRRREELEREARAEEEHLKTRASDTLRRDRERVIRSLRADAAEILVEATAKTLGEVVTGEDQDRLVGDFTRGLGEIR